MQQHRRHALIVKRAQAPAGVEVAILADELAVTPETIRRDLNALERQGLVRRVHGGAVAAERLGFEPTLETRLALHSSEKRRIAEHAVTLVPNHGSVLFDSGTTTLGIAQRLPAGRELRVVTNSVVIASALAGRSDVTLHLLGGRVRTRTGAAVGSWGAEALRNVHIDLAYIGANGISAARGLTTPDQDEATIKHAMVNAAARTVVVADSSKVSINHFSRFAELSQIDTIITDTAIDPAAAQELRDHGPKVITT